MHPSSYLASAAHILQQYDGVVPFAAWLKDFFRQNKKYGSRDRRQIADLCFCFYRLGHTFKQLPVEERLLMGQFLCHKESLFISELKPEWQEKMTLGLKEKLQFLGGGMLFFPLADELSHAIEAEGFQLSHLQQPDLFLRIRPGKEKTVMQKLQHANIPFSVEGACVRLSNSTKVDAIITIDEEAVIQDISSQRVLEPLQLQTPDAKPLTHFWDCCAASGGKTILFYDHFPQAKLTVTDVRESILINLKNRLKRAGIHSFRSFVADVASPDFMLPQKFDFILCDAPCSGSGTWGRTPEQLVFFKPERIDHYTSLQKRIALNASRSLKNGGYFLYITCSVFGRENEEVVTYLRQESPLKLMTQHYLKGYDQKGDTLFVALFTA